MHWLTFVLLSFCAYRVGRFVALDSLIEGTRDKVALWLAERDGLWAEKALDLLTCPYCITIWTGFGATLYWSLALASWPGWWFPVYWLGISTGALLTWVIADPE